MTVLVTGATGNVGSRVVRELLERATPVRAFVRDLDSARAVFGTEVELGEGDFGDQDSIVRALGGVERVFLSSPDGPDKVAHESAVIEACAEAGVGLIVKCSTLLAEPGSPLPPFDWHGRIENRLRGSGVPWVILQSCFFMTNLLASAEQIRLTCRIFAPAGAGRVAMIDPRDTAAVAAVVLSGEGHDGRTYELTGPEAIGYGRVAQLLSESVGGDVEYVDVPDEAMQAGLSEAGAPEWLVEHLGKLFPLVRAGALARTTETVRQLTGRQPRSFSDFARDHADAFRSELVSR